MSNHTKLADHPQVQAADKALHDAIHAVANVARDLADSAEGTRVQAEDLDALRAALRGWSVASNNFLAAVHQAAAVKQVTAAPTEAADASRIKDALAAAGAFLATLCAPHDPPPCFTPKSEPAALGVNAALPIRKLLSFTAGKKLLELRDLVHAARDAGDAGADKEGGPS